LNLVLAACYNNKSMRRNSRQNARVILGSEFMETKQHLPYCTQIDAAREVRGVMDRSNVKRRANGA
jgi:hypothetical protein